MIGRSPSWMINTYKIPSNEEVIMVVDNYIQSYPDEYCEDDGVHRDFLIDDPIIIIRETAYDKNGNKYWLIRSEVQWGEEIELYDEQTNHTIYYSCKEYESTIIYRVEVVHRGEKKRGYTGRFLEIIGEEVIKEIITNAVEMKPNL
ncbi:MAG: hypothetical protein F6K63_35440 [Moorea sp. SIO1G6]|uniref:hypothetical protein n=1 Tax=Moorena sp. SIO1G6 TaxID=2607840 RepID=UPI0013C28422|nr:hypothetical protein [Moorena sp. SIO1G6]NET69393.1 hypothetical protein [Moorena sp. SIO1G6]